MKLYTALVTFFTVSLLNAAEPETNLLSIYLVNDNIFPQWELGTMPKPESLKLISPPVLADVDFMSFDLTNQSFTITPEAAGSPAKYGQEEGAVLLTFMRLATMN